MKSRHYLTIKLAAALVVLAVFIIGAVFFTKLMPPINKTQAGARPESVPAIAAASQAAEKQRISTIAENSNESERSGSETGVLGASTSDDQSTACRNVTIAYKTVYKKVSWLKKGQAQVKIAGKNGYTRVCANTANQGRGQTRDTVPPVDKVVYVGADSNSTLNGLAQKLENFINSID